MKKLLRKTNLSVVALLVFFSLVTFGCSKKFQSYEYGTTIQFGKGGNAEKYQAKGWAAPEEGFTWTDGKTAELQMSVTEPKSDIVMKATLRPFLVPGKLDKQKVVVMVNGNKAGELEALIGGEYAISIPKDSLKKGNVIVTFQFPDAASPSNLGAAKDDRLLGISMQTLMLSEPPAYEYGSNIQFGRGGNAEKFETKGWCAPEEGFTWTDGKIAGLHMSIAEPKSDIVMKAVFHPFLVPGKLDKQTVVVMVNGNKAGQWEASADGEYKITITRASLKGADMNIVFELPDANSPTKLGVAKDDRILGLSLKMLSLSEIK